jgi:prepilin signal peptidase PulO-like enzyme (type II secretory pathway)
MPGFLALLIFAFGAAIGSFLNVVILRYPAEGPVGRSRCPHCRKILAWYELIPIVSFLWQRGQCRSCGHKLSWQYPLVEAAMGAALAALFTPLPESAGQAALAALAAGIVALLLILFVIDLKTMLLPDLFVAVLGILVVAHVAVQITSYQLPITSPLWGAAIGAGFLGILWLTTSGRGLGLGDVKLMVPLGALLGPLETAALLLASFIVGGCLALILLGTGRVTMKTPIPFGPFLAGTAILLLVVPEFAYAVASLTGLSGTIGW